MPKENTSKFKGWIHAPSKSHFMPDGSTCDLKKKVGVLPVQTMYPSLTIIQPSCHFYMTLYSNEHSPPIVVVAIMMMFYLQLKSIVLKGG